MLLYWNQETTEVTFLQMILSVFQKHLFETELFLQPRVNWRRKEKQIFSWN